MRSWSTAVCRCLYCCCWTSTVLVLVAATNTATEQLPQHCWLQRGRTTARAAHHMHKQRLLLWLLLRRVQPLLVLRYCCLECMAQHPRTQPLACYNPVGSGWFDARPVHWRSPCHTLLDSSTTPPPNAKLTPSCTLPTRAPPTTRTHAPRPHDKCCGSKTGAPPERGGPGTAAPPPPPPQPPPRSKAGACGGRRRAAPAPPPAASGRCAGCTPNRRQR